MNEYTEKALVDTITRMAVEMTEQKQKIEELYDSVDAHRKRAFKFAEEGLQAEARVAELEKQMEKRENYD